MWKLYFYILRKLITLNLSIACQKERERDQEINERGKGEKDSINQIIIIDIFM